MSNRMDFIVAIQKLGFQAIDKFGRYQYNNYQVKIELYSRYTGITFSHAPSKLYAAYTDYQVALEAITTKFQ